MKEHNLQKWDKVKLPSWSICEYIKTDGIYSKWKLYDNNWELINDWETFHLWGNELEKQWEYYVITEEWNQ